MGYVNDTAMRIFIPPHLFDLSAGTWDLTESSNLVALARSVADAAFTALIPVVLPGNAIALKGAKLESIDVWYKIGTAAADDFATVELEKMALPADGAAHAGAAVTCTIDAAHDTAAERLAADEHLMNVALDAPAWVDEDDVYWLKLVVDCAAATVFTFYGARANYTLKV